MVLVQKGHAHSKRKKRRESRPITDLHEGCPLFLFNHPSES